MQEINQPMFKLQFTTLTDFYQSVTSIKRTASSVSHFSKTQKFELAHKIHQLK